MRSRMTLMLCLVACQATTEPVKTAVITLPAVATGSPSASASASASTIMTSAPTSELAIIGGDLVDLRTMSVLHTLTAAPVFSHAIGGGTAYVWNRGELRAHEIASGRLLWKSVVADCFKIAATAHAVMCGGSSGVTRYRDIDGASSDVGTRTNVDALLALGGRVIAVHDARIEALDDSGSIVGDDGLPGPPDRNIDHEALSIYGALACGAHRTDLGTEVYCVDATASVAWHKLVPLRGGFVQQVSDVIVLASSAWGSAAVSSTILRTSDGATLLHVAGKHAVAALSHASILDGVVAIDTTHVELLDAKGATQWTWANAATWRDGVRAIGVGKIVALALYSPIATGCQLVGLDASTGALAWTATVDSLPISHSKYSNAVQLDARGATLLLRGHESSQDYAQSFDAVTGAKLGSIVRAR